MTARHKGQRDQDDEKVGYTLEFSIRIPLADQPHKVEELANEIAHELVGRMKGKPGWGVFFRRLSMWDPKDHPWRLDAPVEGGDGRTVEAFLSKGVVKRIKKSMAHK